ncbi:hypothetical protein [Bradyrhizobium sp. RT9a]|uniref:hypothetical protein n=1 Tax=Bradyrhizobium sp. RT9a TaxID=3156384 RepID=UPI0033943820
MGIFQPDLPPSPPPPPPLPPAAHVPTAASGDVQATAAKTRARALQAGGNGSSGTDLTKGDVGTVSTGKASLLGDTQK